MDRFGSRFALGGMALILAGCTAGDKGGGGGDGDGDGGEDGGSSADEWRVTGNGNAWFSDGETDNSLLTLKMVQVTAPEEGTAYRGWVSIEGNERIALGEITVDGEELLWTGETGLDALLGGYDSFEAWAGTEDAPETTALWVGQVKPEVKDSYSALLVSSTDTPNGEGSLRSVETALEAMQEALQMGIDMSGEVDGPQAVAESVANALNGTLDDMDGSGSGETIEGLAALRGDDNLIDLILSHCDDASDAVSPGDPIKDLANYVYDSTNNIGDYLDQADRKLGQATVCAAESSCDSLLYDALVQLRYAQLGEDKDEDGEVDCPPYENSDEIMIIDEGALECAIEFASQMGRMYVYTP